MRKDVVFCTHSKYACFEYFDSVLLVIFKTIDRGTRKFVLLFVNFAYRGSLAEFDVAVMSIIVRSSDLSILWIAIQDLFFLVFGYLIVFFKKFIVVVCKS